MKIRVYELDLSEEDNRCIEWFCYIDGQRVSLGGGRRVSEQDMIDSITPHVLFPHSIEWILPNEDDE